MGLGESSRQLTIDTIARLSVVLRGLRRGSHDGAPPLQLLHEVLKVRHELFERDPPVLLKPVRLLKLRLHHLVDLLRRDAVEEAESHEHPVQLLRVQHPVLVGVTLRERGAGLLVVLGVCAGLRRVPVHGCLRGRVVPGGRRLGRCGGCTAHDRSLTCRFFLLVLFAPVCEAKAHGVVYCPWVCVTRYVFDKSTRVRLHKLRSEGAHGVLEFVCCVSRGHLRKLSNV